MLGDLVELATSTVHPDHEPDLSPGTRSRSRSSGGTTGQQMPPRRRAGSKSEPTPAAAAPVLSSSSAPSSPGDSPLTTRRSAAVAAVASRSNKKRTSAPTRTRPEEILPESQPSSSSSSSSWRRRRQLLLQSIGWFVVAVALSLALELALNTAVAWQTQSKTELAAISQPDPSGSQIAWLLAEKLALLAVFWFGGFDAYDVASLTLLSATPVSILLALFYNIHPATLASETAISIAAHTAPYLFLRPVSAAHRQHPSSSAAATPQTRNHAILTDPWTTITTSLLASAILATSLELSLLSFLPTFLITRFSSLRTLEFAHESPVYVVLPTLLIALIPAGYAAVEFLFVPSTAAVEAAAAVVEASTTTSGETEAKSASSSSSSFSSSSRRQVLFSRTFVLAAVATVETVAFTIGQLQGVEWEGALGYAGLWVGSLSLVGVALDWVGGPAE